MSELVTVRMAKMPFKTKHFNENQKVWMVLNTGCLATYVCGKFRGSGRYIKAWIKYDKKDSVIPEFNEIEVKKSFAESHEITIYG